MSRYRRENDDEPENQQYSAVCVASDRMGLTHTYGSPQTQPRTLARS